MGIKQSQPKLNSNMPNICVEILKGVEGSRCWDIWRQARANRDIFRLFDYGVETLPSTLNSAGLKLDLQQPKMSSCCQFTRLAISKCCKYGRNKGGGAEQSSARCTDDALPSLDAILGHASCIGFWLHFYPPSLTGKMCTVESMSRCADSLSKPSPNPARIFFKLSASISNLGDAYCYIWCNDCASLSLDATW